MVRSTANICAFGWKARDFELKGIDGNRHVPRHNNAQRQIARRQVAPAASLSLPQIRSGHTDGGVRQT
jgi:hypothetical protein